MEKPRYPDRRQLFEEIVSKARPKPAGALLRPCPEMKSGARKQEAGSRKQEAGSRFKLVAACVPPYSSDAVTRGRTIQRYLCGQSGYRSASPCIALRLVPAP